MIAKRGRPKKVEKSNEILVFLLKEKNKKY